MIQKIKFKLWNLFFRLQRYYGEMEKSAPNYKARAAYAAGAGLTRAGMYLFT